MLSKEGSNTIEVNTVFDSDNILLGVNIIPYRKMHHKFDILIIDSLFEESTICDFVIEEETFFPNSDFKAIIIDSAGDSYLRVVYDEITLSTIKDHLNKISSESLRYEILS